MTKIASATAPGFQTVTVQSLVVQTARVTDVVDPPSFEIMAEMIDVIAEEMKQ